MTEQIQKAIEYWEEFKKECAEMIAQGRDRKNVLANQIPMCNTALSALREQLKREQGCEYCNRISKYAGFGYAEWFEQTAADEQNEISIDVKFCPNCGRKLEG